MVGCSLRHRGDELLGILGGLDAYVERGKTFGIPFLYPWANRLGAWGYEVAGRTVAIDPGAGVVRSDPNGLPIHGALARACTGSAAALGADADAAWLDAELDWTAHAHMRAVFPFAHRVALRIALTDTRCASRRPCTRRATTGPALVRLSPVPRAAGRAARGVGGRAAGADRTSRSTSAGCRRARASRCRPSASRSASAPTTTCSRSTATRRASP